MKKKNNTVKQKLQRNKRECPECNLEIIDLSRHLKAIHKWDPEDARTATQHLHIRKQNSRTIPADRRVYKEYHQERPCPVEGCRSNVKRMADHLKGRHKLSRNDPRYAIYINAARVRKPRFYKKGKYVQKTETVT